MPTADSIVTRRWVVLVTVMISMSMVAFEATIVATAMPQIVADLGGLKLYSWVFSSYLLSQTALTVVFGKLADTYGRKPIVLIGIGVFILGSVLAGFAWSMPALIVFRLIQGAGAGALQPAAMTVIADLYPGNQRAKIQGYLASVWAISAVIGPLLGGVIVHNLDWAWIFWINIPIGLIAATGFIVFLREDKHHKRASVDVLGAALSAVAIAALMVLLTEASSSGLVFELGAVGVFIVCGVLFVFQERRAPDPMISFALWRHRPIATANALTLLASMALVGLTTFLPVYVQGVLGQSALVSGFTLTVMLVGWPAGATIAARNTHRFGPRRIMLTGSFLLPIGAAILAFTDIGSSPLQPAAASLVMGFGMGLISITSLLLIQNTTESRERGSGTASNLFCRNLGSTLGAALLGSILNFGLSRSPGGVGVTSDQLRDLLATGSIPGGGDEAIRQLLQDALNLTFIAVLVMAIGTIFVALLVPHIQPNQSEPEAKLADLLPEG